MRPLPHLPFTTVDDLASWDNFHHTVVGRHVPALLTPGGAAPPPTVSMASAQAQAINAILSYCLADPPEPLCILGSMWSLSDILDPANVVMDPGTWNQIAAVDEDWLDDAYKNTRVAGRVPIVAQGGTTIRTLNNWLGNYGLALQTSGASDGHRIAGCIATGTHGSHVKVGAVHDTVLGMYLVTGPNQAVLLQPAVRRFTPDLANWFQDETGLTTQDLADDDLFNAARVALGGLGFVHSIIVEAEPLYQVSGQDVARSLADPVIWNALQTLDTTALYPVPNPDFFSIIFSPYAGGAADGAIATLLWKRKANTPFVPSPPVPASISTDLSRLLSALIPAIDGGLGGDILSAVVTKETSSQYPPGPIQATFPGTYFGPTNLPEGNGRSSEIVVDHQNAVAAVKLVLATLQQEAAQGRHLAGAVGVRNVPGTSALLGPNLHPMNTYIEFPSLATADVTGVQNAIWAALAAAGIPFTCHWGQEYGMDANSIRGYFGNRIDAWKAARQRLLPTPAARAVFSNALLRKMNLV